MRLILRIVRQQRNVLKLHVHSSRSCIQFHYYILTLGKRYQFFFLMGGETSQVFT